MIFFANLAKGDPLQTWDASAISDPVQFGDVLIVIAPDLISQTSYTLVASSILTISSDIYSVNINEATITGGTVIGEAKNTFLSNLTKDSLYQTWNDSSINDPVQIGDSLKVESQDGKATMYSVGYSKNARITSSTYEVANTGATTEMIRGISANTSKAYFLSSLSPGDLYQTINSNAVHDPVELGDAVIVTAQDGTTTITYTTFVNTINIAPTASGVAISGNPYSTSILTSIYSYSDSDGPSWQKIGNSNFSSGNASDHKMAIDNNGVIFLAFRDQAFGGRITVMKYDPNVISPAWAVIGTEGFSPNIGYRFSLAVTSSGIPYIAFSDQSHSNKITVMKYNVDLDEWGMVGDPGFSDDPINDVTIKIDNQGVAFVEYGEELGTQNPINKPVVKKFDETLALPNWTNVGNTRFSINAIGASSMALDKNGIPYVAYEDFNELVWQPSKATVMKYVPASNNWQVVGIRGISPTEIGEINMYVDQHSNIPYVIYQNWATHFKKPIVMKFDTTLQSPSWVNVGSPDISLGLAIHLSMSVDTDGTIFASFSDAGKVVVKKFNPTTSIDWESLPSMSLIGSSHDIISDPFGNTYVAYSDHLNSGANVMKYVASDFEGASSYEWYRDNMLIANATARTYEVSQLDEGHTIYFKVTPKAQTGIITGIPVMSAGLYIQHSGSGGVVNFPSNKKQQDIKILVDNNASPVIVPFKKIVSLSTQVIFGRNLGFGMIGNDVLALQKFLNNNNCLVASSGIGSVGRETNFFGSATRAALIKFQKIHAIKPAYGFFGIITRTLINSIR